MAVGAPAPSAPSRDALRRPLVTAVVLNWNRAALTCRAVRSLFAEEDVNLRAIVVDNGSQPGDAATIRSRTAADVIALGENVGFARAVNAGATVALRTGARYILLFNNDAHVEPGTGVIARLVAALEADPGLGAAGATIGNDDDARSVQSVGYRLSLWFPVPRARAKAAGGRLRRDEYLSGSALLVRASAFAAVRGFDPDYFFYGDDVDFARRLYAAGYGLRLVPARGVRHARGASIGVGSPDYAYTALRSHLILLAKHARPYHLPTAYATLAAATVYLSLRGLARGDRRVPVRALAAWRDFAARRWGGFDGRRLAPAERPAPSDLR